MKNDRAKFFAEYKKWFGVLNQEQVTGLEAILAGIEGDTAITDLRWAAYMLATVRKECADTYAPIVEYGPRSYFDKYEPNTATGKRLGNIHQGDGFEFRGRGYVQITGRTNYERFGIEEYPLQALKPEVAYRIMSKGMREGMFTGKRLSDYINDKVCDYRNARRIINGTDCAEEIAASATKFESILKKA